jgi:hypothetical protein
MPRAHTLSARPRDFTGLACVGQSCSTGQQIHAATNDWRALLWRGKANPSTCGRLANGMGVLHNFVGTCRRAAHILGHCPNTTQHRHRWPCKMSDYTQLIKHPLPCSTSHGEESFIVDYFFGGMQGSPRRDGVFLELGAVDGLQMSSTLHLERCLGWHGVLIEGSPRNFPYIAWNRPRALTLRTAICEHHGRTDSLRRSGRRLSGVPARMAPNGQKRFKLNLSNSQPRVRVACGPLGDWLSLLRLKHVDFFSLRSELTVLETLDWSSFSVHVMLVECYGAGQYGCLHSEDERIIQFLQARGVGLMSAFRTRHDIWNMVFMNDSRVPAMDARALELLRQPPEMALEGVPVGQRDRPWRG